MLTTAVGYGVYVFWSAAYCTGVLAGDLGAGTGCCGVLQVGGAGEHDGFLDRGDDVWVFGGVVLVAVDPVGGVGSGEGGDTGAAGFDVVQGADEAIETAAGDELAFVVGEQVGFNVHVAAGEDACRLGVLNGGFGDVDGVVVDVPALFIAFRGMDTGEAIVAAVGVEVGSALPIPVDLILRQVFDDVFAADELFNGAEVVVEVVDLPHGELQLAQGFNGGAAVVEGIGFASGKVVHVQSAAQAHVAATEDEGAFIVEQGLGAYVELLSGGDGAADAVFGSVGEIVGLDGEVVTIHAAGTQVCELVGLYAGELTIDEAPVSQSAGIDEGLPCTDLARGLVVEGETLQLEVVAGFENALVDECTGGVKVEVAVALQGAGVGVVLG